MPETARVYNHHLDQVAAGILDYKNAQDIILWAESLNAEEKKEVVRRAVDAAKNSQDQSARLFFIVNTLEIFNDAKIDNIIREAFIRDIKKIIAENKNIQTALSDCVAALTSINYDYTRRFTEDSQVDNILRKFDL